MASIVNVRIEPVQPPSLAGTKFPMTDMVIKGLWTVDKWLGEHSVTESPYREKLLVIGGKGLHHEIRREMAVIGQGGSRVAACAIAKHLNKQRLAAHLKIHLN